MNNEDAVSACKSRPSSKVASTQTQYFELLGLVGNTSSKIEYESSCTPCCCTTGTKLSANPLSQPVKQSSVKTISFAVANHNGGIEYYVPKWVQNWVKKNAKKYRDIQFTQEKGVGNSSYLIVFSDSAHALSGFEPVTHTSTSTSTTPYRAAAPSRTYYGDRWNYTYDGTVTTTTTTDSMRPTRLSPARFMRPLSIVVAAPCRSIGMSTARNQAAMPTIASATILAMP